MSRSTTSGANTAPRANTSSKAGVQSVMNIESISATRRKASSITVPDLDEDAAERKRALNVLAQRRYRKRKREYLRKLEASVVGYDGDDDDAEATEPASTYDMKKSAGLSRRTSKATGLISPPATSTSSPNDRTTLPEIEEESTIHPPQLAGPAMTDLNLEQSFDISINSTDMDWFDTSDTHFLRTTSLCTAQISNMNRRPPNVLWASTIEGDATNITAFDTAVHETASTQGAEFGTFEQWPLASASPSTSPSDLWHSTPSPNSTNATRDTDIDDIDAIISSTKLTPFQSLALSPQTYPQSPSIPYTSNIAVLELDLLRAATSIAASLSISDLVFDLFATSPFATSPSPPPTHHLPPNLIPTLIQTTTPHHPILDTLPWPSVRNRLIAVFALPPQHRPPIAQAPTALLEFVYDIEDGAEGVRVHGSDPLDEKNWEVGEQVLKNWWWAFDRGVLGRSNVLRRRRGAGALSGGGEGGMVMGEV